MRWINAKGILIDNRSISSIVFAKMCNDTDYNSGGWYIEKVLASFMNNYYKFPFNTKFKIENIRGLYKLFLPNSNNYAKFYVKKSLVYESKQSKRLFNYDDKDDVFDDIKVCFCIKYVE